MVPGRAKRVFSHQPARRENHEIAIGRAGRVGRRSQHGKNRRVRMVVADRADGHEIGRVVFAGHQIAMPGDHIEWAAGLARHPQLPAIFLDDVVAGAGRGCVIKRGRGHTEIARIGQPVGANWPEFGQPKMRAVVFANIAARRAVQQRHAESHAARHHGHFAGADRQDAELGRQHQPPLLRHQQHFAVGVDQGALVHRLRGEINVRGHAGLCIGVAIGHQGAQAIDKIERLVRNLERIPAQGVRRCRYAARRAGRP